MNKIQKYIPDLFFVLVAMILVARIYLSATHLLESWDESIYAQLGVEFAKIPDFVSYYNSEVWVEKPFLIGTITGLLQLISPYNKLLLQGFFGFISVLNLVLVWQISKQILDQTPKKESKSGFSNSILALLAPIFVINTYLFFERSTTVNTDTVLVFGLLGYYFYRDKFWQKLFFLCIAVWTKSLLGFLPLLLEIALNYKNIFDKDRLKQYAALFLVPSLWYLAALIRFGNDFVQKHFVEQILSRATNVLESHNGEWWFYLDYYVKTSPASFILLCTGIIITIYLLFHQKTKLQRFDPIAYQPIILCVIYLVIISASQSKLEWYLLPVIYLISPLVPTLLAKANKYLIAVSLMVFTVSGFVFLAYVPFFSRNSKTSQELGDLAKCLNTIPKDKITLFQTKESIRDYDDLISKNGNISSTFRYGGSPVFVYYAGKKQIEFVYHADSINLDTNRINVIPKNDTRFNQVLVDNQDKISEKCSSDGFWVVG